MPQGYARAVTRWWAGEAAPDEDTPRRQDRRGRTVTAVCHDNVMTTPARIRVREARAQDEPALLALDVAAWSPQSGFPSEIEHSRQPGYAFFTADNPPWIHLVAEQAGSVVGYVRLKPPTSLPENAHVLLVAGLAVDTTARRLGVASRLLAAAQVYAVAHGAGKLSLRVLGTNSPAIALYEKFGFEREGVLRGEFVIDGAYVDDVVMAKHLPANGPGFRRASSQRRRA